MPRIKIVAAISVCCLALFPLQVSAVDLQGFMDAASAAQGILKGFTATPPEKKQTLQGRQAEAQAREDEAAAAKRANLPASSAEQVSGTRGQAADSTPFAAYAFKTPLRESLGTADLTGGLLPISVDDRRLSPAARSALAGLLYTFQLFSGGTPNDGLLLFNANKELTDQERAQTIGMALAQLRSSARINDVYGASAKEAQYRTGEGGRLVSYFVKSVPDAKNIHFVWMQPDDPGVRRPTIGTAGIRTPGRQMAGNLGDFLASAFQHKGPGTEGISTYYKLYDERMSPLVLARVDDQLASNDPTPWQKASRGPATPSRDQSILDGYSGNATNVGGHVTEAAPKVSSGQEEVPKARPRMVLDKNGKVVIDPATGRPLLQQPD